MEFFIKAQLLLDGAGYVSRNTIETYMDKFHSTLQKNGHGMKYLACKRIFDSDETLEESIKDETEDPEFEIPEISQYEEAIAGSKTPNSTGIPRLTVMLAFSTNPLKYNCPDTALVKAKAAVRKIAEAMLPLNEELYFELEDISIMSRRKYLSEFEPEHN